MGTRKLVKALIPAKIFRKIEPTGHKLEMVIAQTRRGFPSRGLNFIGVTGTSGKTTTTTLMASVLRAAGYKTAYFTTVAHDFGDGPEHNTGRMTTLGGAKMLRNIQKAKENGCTWVVLEVGSHALAQGRVWGIPFKAGVITNLSHEHLDYHGTFENYRAAKQKLFKLVKRYGGVGVVNADDSNVNYFEIASKTVTFGREKSADVMAKDIKSTSEGSNFVISGRLAPDFRIETKLPGGFNISNVLGVAATALSLGLSSETIIKGIADLPSVPGRMASYKTSKGFTTIIDFAHTPDSFEKIFKEVRPLTKGKLTVVFGCAGERDQARRYLQGTLSADFCDRIILTEDDPRSEDNRAIMNQIKEGIAKSKKKPEVLEIDLREEAIDKSIELALAGDVILLLSKGHEKTIALANGDKAWDEETALKNSLKKFNIGLL
ncbi:MAG: UDP-N-acetylmuramoyl-L-alanyl-D-glutamate--2,6-diaminopimelate ligase [Patescibacteria group bacterium]